MARGYIDSTGSHIPEYDEILQDIIQDVKSIYGEDLYLEPDSKDGQLLSVFALSVYNNYLQGESAYNSFSPTTAQGVGLSSRVSINGLQRKVASNSMVDVIITGQPGTIIRDGVCEDITGNKWSLPPLVTIPTSATITVTATSQEVGSVRLNIGELNKISTPTRGWISVTNPQPATIGNATETDAELRIRQRKSTNIPSQSILSGLEGAIAEVDGVLKWRCYENDSGVADLNGIPAHSVAIVVSGGSTSEIANIILNKKSIGCYTYGTTSYEIIDKYNTKNIINFFRPTVTVLKVKLNIKALNRYTNEVETTIKANLIEYIKNLGIGEVIYHHRLVSIINASDRVEQFTFDILSLQLAKGSGSFSANNIVQAFNESAGLAEDNIEIIVTESNS